jgi:methylphosphotriester-DNA--protein-cysteine methyltransferase
MANDASVIVAGLRQALCLDPRVRLRTVCERLGISTDTARRCLTSELGYTYRQLQASHQAELFARLLVAPDLPMQKQQAFAAGYQTTRSFARRRRCLLGCK